MESHSARKTSDDAPLSGPAHAGLTASVVMRDSIDARCVNDMYQLYSANYLDTSAELFRSDLAGKTHVLLLQNEAEQLCGFSTIELYSSQVDSEVIRVIYSGDTIIAPAYWGSPVLAFEWIRFAGSVERQSPEYPLYWLLIVKGHRTYRFLPTFARHYVPHHGLAAGADARIREVLATKKFGAHYNPHSGVVRFPSCMGRLSPALATIPDRHLRLPEVAHFLELNPGYRDGDELVCLCRLSPENLKPRAAKIFLQSQLNTVLN